MAVACSYCKNEVDLAFKVVAKNKDGRAVDRLACFPCISEIGEKAMREHRARQGDRPSPPPP